jgi:CDP-6-deoxy-D-xylo-4-hexulose-3-dehydrase
VGWSTTITPFLQLGFEPIFVDTHKSSPLMDCHELDKILKNNEGEIAAVFYTTLLGIRDGAMVDDHMQKIKNFCDLNKVELYVDSCEDTIGIFSDMGVNSIKAYLGEKPLGGDKIKAETTSFYLAHEFQACPEMGAIFTNDKEQYKFYLMARNHGMTRHLEDRGKFKNDLVDPKFEFGVVGNNFRPTELSAYAVSLDLKRKQNFRIDIAKDFYYSGSSKIWYYTIDYMFALPIVIRQEYGEEKAKYFIDKIKGFAEELGIETRPIVGGNLLRQTIFREYGDYKDYPNAEWFHKYGIYVGLYKKMNKRILMKFRDRINQL